MSLLFLTASTFNTEHVDSFPFQSHDYCPSSNISKTSLLSNFTQSKYGRGRSNLVANNKDACEIFNFVSNVCGWVLKLCPKFVQLQVLQVSLFKRIWKGSVSFPIFQKTECILQNTSSVSWCQSPPQGAKLLRNG